MTSSIEQPPASGPGSGVTAWREYAAAVTGEPVAEFDDMSRDEIIEYLESSDTETAPVEDMTGTEGLAEANDPEAAPESAPEGSGWMVPTDKGWKAE